MQALGCEPMLKQGKISWEPYMMTCSYYCRFALIDIISFTRSQGISILHPLQFYNLVEIRVPLHRHSPVLATFRIDTMPLSTSLPKTSLVQSTEDLCHYPCLVSSQ